jgi:DNA-binding CsgD family transcriptional regulator
MESFTGDATFDVLRGLEGVRARLIDIEAECSTSIWSFHPDGAASAAGIEAAQRLDEPLLGRGVQMRTVYLDSVRNHRPTLEHAEWLTEHGAEVRTVPALPMRLLLVDARCAVFPIDPDNSKAGAIVTGNRSAVTALCSLFEEYWRSGSPFGRRRPRRSGTLNAAETQAINLWGQGHTNDAVARRMGVSERTVYRYSESVRRALGAGSAFQAGVRAVELGLIAGEEERSSGDVRN